MATVRKCHRCEGTGSLQCPDWTDHRGEQHKGQLMRCGMCGGDGVLLRFKISSDHFLRRGAETER
jgi:hypothetical protein